jgi:Flp pilus assembly protein TadG
MGGMQQNQHDDGSEVVEFGLVLLPLLAVVFFIFDICWLVFAQGTLQHAAQEGVRYAVVGNSADSVKLVVQQNAMGFLGNTPDGLSKIDVSYYAPSDLKKSITGPASMVGGNVVEVSISGVQVSLLGPIWGVGAPSLKMSASSSDVLESTPPSS